MPRGGTLTIRKKSASLRGFSIKRKYDEQVLHLGALEKLHPADHLIGDVGGAARFFDHA